MVADPTLLDLAKAKGFEGHDIDGHSLVPLLSGKAGAVDMQRPQWALSQVSSQAICRRLQCVHQFIPALE